MCEHDTYSYAWDASIQDAVEPLKAELDQLKQRLEKIEALLLELIKPVDKR